MNHFGFQQDAAPAVKNLIIINVIFFAATYLFQSVFKIELTRILGLYYFKSEFFQPYQLVSHMFMHGSLFHIFFNMFMLWMFGRVLEQVWGTKRFLLYYFITGLGAAALHILINHLTFMPMVNAAEAFSNTPTPDLFNAFLRQYYPSHNWGEFLTNWKRFPDNMNYINEAVSRIELIVSSRYNIPTVGASGAVYGILLGFAMFFPNTPLFIWFIPVPIKAKWVVIGAIVIELWQGVNMPGSNIAHFAHLGGMLFGYLLIKFWNTTNRSNYY